MKSIRKILLVAVGAVLFVTACEKSYAQSPYKASVGGLLPYSSIMGPSFKAFFTDKVAFQTDIFYKAAFVGTIEYGIALYASLETNTNIVYQKKLKDEKRSELFYFVGGGVSLGYEIFDGNGKFGVNSIFGLEYVFKNTPIAFQMDLRPGYGLLYNLNDIPVQVGWIFSPPVNKNPWSHFDWAIGFTLRYAFKEKEPLAINN